MVLQSVEAQSSKRQVVRSRTPQRAIGRCPRSACTLIISKSVGDVSEVGDIYQQPFHTVSSGHQGHQVHCRCFVTVLRGSPGDAAPRS